MTLSLERVKERFALFSGEDPDEETARGRLCAALCEDALARGDRAAIEAHLSRHGIEAPAAAALAESWCAAEAFYQLALTDEAALPKSLSADGISLDLTGRSEKAKLLRDETLGALGRLLGEEAVYFGLA